MVDGQPLERTRLVEEVCRALTRAELPAGSFAGHSFRIGQHRLLELRIVQSRPWDGGRAQLSNYTSVHLPVTWQGSQDPWPSVICEEGPVYRQGNCNSRPLI